MTVSTDDLTALDRDAFGERLQRHRRELHLRCYRLLGSFEESEDLVQETFLRAWRRRETYAGRTRSDLRRGRASGAGEELVEASGAGRPRGRRSTVDVRRGSTIPGSPSRSVRYCVAMDRAQLADFLRRRREALQPEDVGLDAGPRRRAKGLRREEVALLAHMSTDYYARLEQQRGPQPSVQMLGAIARALRLDQDERDHVLRLAGHTAPRRARRTDHVNPALLRVLERLDTPAQVMSDLGETLVQNDLAVALLGDQTHHTGPRRSLLYRWFTDPGERELYAPDDRERHARAYVAHVRAGLAGDPGDADAAELVERLLADSAEFAALWEEHEVAVRLSDHKRLVHPRVGAITLHCQHLVAADEGQVLLVYTAVPGSEDADKLRLLAVIGNQRFDEPARS
jgi:transcriptional regulator with XRE-family HTH domain